MKDSYDVIVIGGGASGIWAARSLARARLSVLLLEAFDLPDSETSRRIHDSSNFVSRKKFPYLVPAGKPFDWKRIWGLGGRTVAWGGHLLRLSDFDLSAGERDGFGSPWPIKYADLQEHYSQVEAALRVSGRRDGLSRVPDGEFERAPAEKTVSFLKKIVENRWSDATAITGRFANVSVGSLLGAGVDSGFLDVFANSLVTGLTTSEDGKRIAGVRIKDTRTLKSNRVTSKFVLLGCSTILSTALLLKLRSAKHPDGLGNASRLLGTGLMDHTVVRAEGVFTDKTGMIAHDPNASTPRPMSYVPRFQNIERPDREYLRGFGIQVYWRRCEAHVKPGGRCSLSSSRKHDSHVIFLSFGEVLPNRKNRIHLDPRRVDRFGSPLIHIDFEFGSNEELLIQDQISTIKAIASDARISLLAEPVRQAPGAAIHEVGTAKMGGSPEDSVINSFCQSWDVENLYVVDGSGFPSLPAQNPTLTMMALSGRAAAQIIERAARRTLKRAA